MDDALLVAKKRAAHATREPFADKRCCGVAELRLQAIYY